MKIKTSELTGATLDWAVAIAEGYGEPNRLFLYGEPKKHVRIANQDGIEHTYAYSFKANFSTDWSQGGPIIEREISELYEHKPLECWAAKSKAGDLRYGPASLIAAMRCYVASKLGDEVEVPDELSTGQAT